MAGHNLLGQEGERQAMLYLTQKGYTLLDCNWRYEHLEIDIVAEWHGEIVFVEVKTRTNENYAPISDAVTLQKKRNIIEAAHRYLAFHRLQDHPYSYDIITLIGNEKPFTIHHIPHAYNEEEVWKARHHRHDFEV